MAMTRSKLVNALTATWLGVGLVILLWAAGSLLAKVQVVATIVLVAIMFAYAIYPAVKRFSRRMPRPVAVLLMYAIIVAVVGIGAASIAPSLSAQIATLARDFPAIQQQLRDPTHSTILQSIPTHFRPIAVLAFAQGTTLVQRIGTSIADQAVAFGSATVSVVTGMIVVFVIAYFLIVDLEAIQEAFFRLVPRNRREEVLEFALEVDAVIGGFVRGQILVAAIVASLATLLLLADHVSYALLLGVFTGAMDIVPYLGAIIGIVPAVLVAYFTAGGEAAVVALVGYILIYEVEGHIISPAVVGKFVGITPLVVILSMLAGGEAFGLTGLLLAVPAAGVIRVALLRKFQPSAHADRLLAEARATADAAEEAS